MATKVEKKSVSLSPEILAEIEVLKIEKFHLPKDFPLSSTISCIIEYTYWMYRTAHGEDEA